MLVLILFLPSKCFVTYWAESGVNLIFFLNKEEDFERKDAEGDGKSFKNSITKTK